MRSNILFSLVMKVFSFFLLCTLFFGGCTVHQVHDFDTPCVELTDDYSHLHPEPAVDLNQPWWREFCIEELNEIVDEALGANLDLNAAWWRLVQAEQEAVIKNAPKWPTINGLAEAESKHTRDGVLNPGSPIVSTSRFLVSGSLSYEVDLWKKIDSQAQAAAFQVLASEEDVLVTELVLSGRAVEYWLAIQEQKALLHLIESQIQLNKTLLELVELRFSMGQASALDVYQQRLQLTETATQVIPAHMALEIANDQLQVLLGEPPSGRFLCSDPYPLPPLPPFPCLGRPLDLFDCRPDLRAQRDKLYAADYEVAAAIADCFPRFTLSMLLEMRCNDIGDLFKKQMGNIVGSLLMPLFDGGRRRAEVYKKRALVCEKWMLLGQNYLNALLEVEEALVKERYQQDLIVQLHRQLSLAKKNLTEAKHRYLNGLIDYLPVIAAIQALQRIERRMIVEQKILLSNRAKLYRALGGAVCF